MIGILDWEIRALDTTLPVTGGNINIDDQNIPAIVATVVVPYDEDLFNGLDPRQTPVPRVTVNGAFTEWAAKPISAMSAQAATAGGTIADLSAAWAGLQFWDVTDMFASPLNVAASYDDQTMSLDLHVREIAEDGFEMVINLASDEALLMDWSATSEADRQLFLDIRDGMDTTKIRTWVDPTLRVVLGYGLDPTVYDSQTLSVASSDLLTPIRETNALDYMRPFLEDTDLKLRVGRSGRGFTLQRAENELPDIPWFSLFTEDNVISVKRVYSRTGEWYDSAELISDVSADAGYPDGPHSRTYNEDFGKRLTSVSMAQNIVRRTQNRGRFIDIKAPIRLGVFMRDEFTYAPEGSVPGPDIQWAVKSVSYDLTTGTMSIRGAQRY